MVASLPSDYWWYERRGGQELELFLDRLVQEGAWFVRFLLYYPLNPPSQVNRPERGIYAPFKVNREKRAFDLNSFEEKYWQGYRKLLRVLKRKGLVPVVSVLDYPEQHHPESRSFSFWFRNVQGVRGLRDRRLLPYAVRLLRKTIEETRRVFADRWLLELGNEFSFEGSAQILRRLMEVAVDEMGFPAERVVVPFSPDYDRYDNLRYCSAALGKASWGWKVIPAYHFSRMEDFAVHRRQQGWKWMMSRFHTFLFSTDGLGGVDRRDVSVLLRVLREAYMEVAVKYGKELLFEEQPVWIWKKRRQAGAVLMHDLRLLPAGWISRLREELQALTEQNLRDF